MPSSDWLLDLDQVHSSVLVLLTLAGLGTALALLYVVGALGAALRGFARGVRAAIRLGFSAWEHALAWASWPVFLGITLALLILGWAVTGTVPGLTVLCALLTLFMGCAACLAYMSIDIERYEVERGYKALHDPAKGQGLALHLLRYGHQVRVPLLAAATIGMIGGFALLNQGLYESVGRAWYQPGDETAPGYADFLASALLNLLRVVDVLNLAESRHFLHLPYVHPARWPASVLLAAFRSFFTLVLLQQIFASIRQGRLLFETISDLWSPHPPIHERARSALPQFGAAAAEPLLVSLRSLESLTKEQRDQLPEILAAIGPTTIPTLLRHLDDSHEHVRAVVAGTLGRLRALEAVPLLVPLAEDPSDLVRQAAVEALGRITAAGTQRLHRFRRLRKRLRKRARLRWLAWWHKKEAPAPTVNPLPLVVVSLRSALADRSAAVRTQAAEALGWVGPPAASAAADLVALLDDGDESVRCRAAEALPLVGGPAEEAVRALAVLLEDASSPVKAAAANALGALKKEAAPAVPALVSLLQDREEAVRTAAAAAVGQIGCLNGAAAESLREDLASPDNVVRAQAAEALGTIGAPAQETAPALVAVLADSNDVVRAKAVEALGKMGEAAAPVAVSGLTRALRDQDNWVSALAAEALGQMGEAADAAVPALVRALRHLNPQVRTNAAEALGKMGEVAVSAAPALEKACRDEDGGVRAQALRALGALGEAAAGSEPVVMEGLRDADPLVRAAAVETLGRWGATGEAVVEGVLALLEDASDPVKAQAAQVLPKLAGAVPPVIEGLCRRLLEDDSAWVQVQAAQGLGRLGPAAAAAGPSLLRAVQTGEEAVREQAMRAIAIIQPPEMPQAFLAGLHDASADIRQVASGGWRKAAAIPEEVIPALVEALADPDTAVRANAAHALGRLDSLPSAAIPLLAACTTDPSDSLRLNAVMALRRAPAGTGGEELQHLLEDGNERIRLIAAGALLAATPEHPRAGAVLTAALGDSNPRVRRAAVELLDSLGAGARAFRETVEQRAAVEVDGGLQDLLTRLCERLRGLAEPQPAAG
jgi:HEAT repeat protein